MAASKRGGAAGAAICARRVGFDVYPLRTANQPWFASGLAITKTGSTEMVACTQEHQAMEGRDPVRAGTLDQYHDQPDFARAAEREHDDE